MEKIHKIGVPKIIVKTYALFNLVGLWTSNDSISIGQYFRFIYFSLVMVCIAVEAFSTDSADEGIFLIVTTFIGTVQLCKMYCLIWKQREITKITWDIGVHRTDDFKVFSSATKKLKNYTMLLSIFEAYMVVAGAAVVIIPIATRRIIFNIAFPLDYENNDAAFWTTYAFISLGFLLSIVCCMFAPIIWYLMMNLTIKYDMLGSQFKHLFNDATQGTHNNATIDQNGMFLKRFIETIKVHERTYETIEQFASSFSNLFLLQIVTSSICICGTIYTLAFSNHENLLEDLFYTAVLFYSLVDIFMIMYMGNEIKLSSDRLSLCLYESNWIGQTETYKWLMIIVLERLKKPQEIIVGKLFPLNLESFDAIVHGAYSMFNLLQNVRN